MEINKRRGDTWRMLLVISAAVLAGGVLFAWSRILFPVLAAFLIAWITHPPGLEIVYYTREAGSLCEEFEGLLKSTLERWGSDFRRVDVDSSTVLKKKFGARVPVLEINGKIIVEGRVSAAELEHRLEKSLEQFS